MIFYPLHAVLIREQLTVTTDKRGTYKATPRGVLVLNKPLTVPIITDEINSEPVERVWKSAVDMEFDKASRTAFTAPMTARKREVLRGLEPGEVASMNIGSLSFYLLNEWWIGAKPATLTVTTTDKTTDKEVSGYIIIDHNRQTVTGYSERGDNGLSPSEMLAAGWLMCWPWLLVSPDWQAYTIETD